MVSGRDEGAGVTSFDSSEQLRVLFFFLNTGISQPTKKYGWRLFSLYVCMGNTDALNYKNITTRGGAYFPYMLHSKLENPRAPLFLCTTKGGGEMVCPL